MDDDSDCSSSSSWYPLHFRNKLHHHHHKHDHRCTKLWFSSSSNSGRTSQDDHDETNNATTTFENDHEDEEWIPPGGTSSPSTSSSGGNRFVSSNNNNESQLYTQQRRIDEATDALFVLTPEEEATMTEEELSKRIDEVLQLENELEEQAFQLELQREQQQAEQERMQDDEELENETMISERDEDADVEPAIDWLRTRREALGGQEQQGRSAAVNPTDASSSTSRSTNYSQIIPNIPHKLLSCDEIQSVLEFYGGHDIVVIEDDVEFPRMGGADGMIFCSSSNGGNGHGLNDGSGSQTSRKKNHRSSTAAAATTAIMMSPIQQYQQAFRVMALTRGLVDHMRERKLQDIGVPGAQLSLGKKTQQLQSYGGRIGSRGGGGGGFMSSNNTTSSWQIIDCRNYIVHIMDPITRTNLDLEALWTGKDPLWTLDWTDDDAVDDYVGMEQRNMDHRSKGLDQNDERQNNDDYGTGWDDGRLIHRLERMTVSTSRHRPVISSATKRRDRTAGRRRRRQQREQKYQQRYR